MQAMPSSDRMRLRQAPWKTFLLMAISAFIFILTQVGCRDLVPKEAPKSPVIRYNFLVTPDPVNWLWQISTNQSDPQFSAMLENAATKELDPAQHPLSGLTSSMTKAQFKSWFADLAVGNDNVPPELILEVEFLRAVYKLQEQLIKRLKTDRTKLDSIAINDLKQIFLTFRTVDPTDVSEIFFSPKTQVGFYETYTYSELSPAMEKLRGLYHEEGNLGQTIDFLDLLKDYKIEDHPGRTAPMILDDGPVVGFVSRENTRMVDSLLSSPAAKAVLPKTLLFAWNQYPVEEWPDLFPLLALKTNAYGKPRVPGTDILYARQDFEPNSTMPMVSIEFDLEGKREWSRMTRSNVGRQVAIVVNGFVLTYPTIQQEIIEGRAQITGLFSAEEARELAASIRGGSYPATLYVLSRDSTIEQR